MKPEHKTHNITIRLPLYQYNALKRDQFNTGENISKIVRTLIDNSIYKVTKT